MAPPVLQWLRRRGLVVKREFSVPWGICDLVGVKLDAERVRRRMSLGQVSAIGPRLRLHILSRIPDHESKKSITLTRLEREFSAFMPREVLQSQLDSLAKSGFIVSPKRGLFQKINGWAPLHVRIVAVELKLSRISDAIAQARANCAFATDSYVALPGQLALRIARSPRARTLTLSGIGLLAVWRQTCREVVRPWTDAHHYNEVIQAHVVERFGELEAVDHELFRDACGILYFVGKLEA